MSDVYDIWLYPLQDWWRTVNEMADFMSIGQMGNFIFRPVRVAFWGLKYTFSLLIVLHLCFLFHKWFCSNLRSTQMDLGNTYQQIGALPDHTSVAWHMRVLSPSSL